jgi:beta-lactam-binding protein with PASTA domain
MSQSKKRNNWIIKNLLRGFAVIIALIFITSFILKIITRHNNELSVPDLSGLTIKEATVIAEETNIRLDVTDSVYLPRMARGAIFRQNPAAGSKVKKNRRILLTINSVEPKRIGMPNVIGLSLRQAKAELTVRQLNIGTLTYIEDIATNNVMAQKYNGRYISAGTPIETESYIDLELGLNPNDNMTNIPSVLGFSLTTARDILIDNSLNIGILTYDSSVKNYSDSVSSFVIRQNPSPTDIVGSLMGTKVDLVLSIDKTKLN